MKKNASGLDESFGLVDVIVNISEVLQFTIPFSV